MNTKPLSILEELKQTMASDAKAFDEVRTSKAKSLNTTSQEHAVIDKTIGLSEPNKKYDMYSEEYIGNGHYQVCGVEYMSLWTWRRKRGFPSVSHAENKRIGLKITPNVCAYIRTEPDIGGYDIIKAYEVSFLDKNPENILELHNAI